MNPTCFVSYAWESDSHKDWVRGLATKLEKNKVRTLLDQWDLRPGMDMLRYMETAVRESDRVVLVCTPAFAEKANQRLGGVGFEQSIVSAELFYAAGDNDKFVPLLRAGVPRTALPSYLQSRVFIDFRDDSRFDSALEELLATLHKVPKYKRPELGPVPPEGEKPSPSPANETRPHDSQAENETRLPVSQAEYGIVFEFAGSFNGLNFDKANAAIWTDDFIQRWGYVMFGVFKEAFSYAWSGAQMNLPTRSDAAEFAEMWLRDYSNRSFTEFKERFSFASSPSGLNLSTPQEAADWAFKRLSKPAGSK